MLCTVADNWLFSTANSLALVTYSSQAFSQSANQPANQPARKTGQRPTTQIAGQPATTKSHSQPPTLPAIQPPQPDVLQSPPCGSLTLLSLSLSIVTLLSGPPPSPPSLSSQGWRVWTEPASSPQLYPEEMG